MDGTKRGLAFVVAFSTFSFGQTPKPSQPCVMVKRHVHKFGENMSRLRPHRPFDYVAGDSRQDSNGAQNSVTAMFEISSKKAAEWWFSNPITKPPT